MIMGANAYTPWQDLFSIGEALGRVVIPAVASLMPGIELSPKLAVIPILNTSLICKEIVGGTYHWNYIALIFLSTCVYAAAALFLATKMFQRESVLFRS